MYKVWVWFCLSGLWPVACWWGRNWTWRKQRGCQLVLGWKLDGLGHQQRPAEQTCKWPCGRSHLPLSFLSYFLSWQEVISEPAGVAKMTRVMMMMIYHTDHPISNTPVRNELMSIIGQQPCGACHPKENIFGPENMNCDNYAGTEV